MLFYILFIILSFILGFIIAINIYPNVEIYRLNNIINDLTQSPK